ncbi:AAA domain-containing protein, partial [Rhizobium leguminosarum]|nr:AAA domain-containing protein [Rhizobium leguminosarum]
IQVPSKIAKLADNIELIKTNKNKAVRNQKYEEAAQLRDQEKKLYEKFELEKTKWEQELKSKRYPITVDDVAAVIASTTGIPLQRIAHQKDIHISTLKQQLQARIIGQEAAIDKVVKTIQRTHIGLQDPNKPLGTFMFLGPTGVGKTELAKALAATLFTNKDALIRIDMSEYMEKFNVSRLIGAPPGYVGYEEGGQLTEKIRKNPYSVVLLDEIEKAHPDVYNVLLQMMDDGILTDGLGRRIDCRHAIIIMTSNVGARDLQNAGIGFQGAGGDMEEIMKEKVEKALQRTF